MAKNLMGKSRKIENAYAVFESGGWKWYILKVNQSLDKAAANPYASAFCAVSSPMTHGGYDYGDTYLHDIGPGKAAVLAALRAKEKELAQEKR